MAPASAAAADAMCTTVPPAKSSAPRCMSQPPPQTQWASGEYTRMLHSPMKIAYAENLMRSAKAPVMSAAVMIANMPWNIAKTGVGIVPVTWPTTPASPM